MPKNKPIKFARNYKMLFNQSSATLLRVDSLNSDMVTMESRDFATKYDADSVAKSYLTEDGPDQGSIEYDELHSGSVLRLTFLGCKGVPFLKFLRSNDKTWKRYQGQLQQEFQIVVDVKPDIGKIEPSLNEGD